MRALNSAFIPMMITASIIRQIKFLCKHFLTHLTLGSVTLMIFSITYNLDSLVVEKGEKGMQADSDRECTKTGNSVIQAPSVLQNPVRAPNDDFLLNTLITLFSLSTILLDF